MSEYITTCEIQTCEKDQPDLPEGSPVTPELLAQLGYYPSVWQQKLNRGDIVPADAAQPARSAPTSPVAAAPRAVTLQSKPAHTPQAAAPRAVTLQSKPAHTPQAAAPRAVTLQSTRPARATPAERQPAPSAGVEQVFEALFSSRHATALQHEQHATSASVARPPPPGWDRSGAAARQQSAPPEPTSAPAVALLDTAAWRDFGARLAREIEDRASRAARD